MELPFIILISFLISFTWIYYFKIIDLFEKENTGHIVFTFILGTIIPFSIYLIHDYIYEPFGIEDSTNPVYSLLFYTFGVGLLEETIKCIPLLIVLLVFPKAVNEPLDYVKYICISALGFAFGENVEYALSYGEQVLLGRSILSVPAHMFFSALFIYGFIEYKYHRQNWLHVVKYILLACLSHGIYDFLLMFEVQFIGVVLNILFFFVLISAFVTILNNNINHSPFYSPKKIIDQEKVRKHLVIFYIPILISILILTAIYKDAGTAASVYYMLMLWKASILYVLIIRLSRFSIIPQVKKKVKLEFPFQYKAQPDKSDFQFFFGYLTVKGESHNEARLASFFMEDIMVVPLGIKRIHLPGKLTGIIEQKISLNESSHYILKLYLDPVKGNFKHYLIKPKTTGISHTQNNDPIVSLNSLDSKDNYKLVFHEWVVLKQQKTK